MIRAALSTGSAPPAQAPAPIPRQVWGIAAVVTFGTFMSGLDTSLVNVGIETIGRDLHADLATTQWMASGYLLALAAALPMSGWTSRRLGSGRAWLLALGAFTITSALCATAPGIGALIVFRVLQGLAGGLLVTTGMTILAQAAGRAAMGRVLSIIGVPTVLAPALGPTVGALIIAHASWQFLFVINVPIGVLGVLLGLRFVPRGTRGEAGPLDLAGLALVAAGLPLLTYGITTAAQQRTLLSTPVLSCLLAGALALVVFAHRSLNRRFPLVDLRLFTNRVYAAATSLTLFSGAALLGGQIVMPLYFQVQRDQTILDTGLLLAPFGLGAAATFPVAGRLTDRFGGGRVAGVGFVITTLVTIPMAMLGADAGLVGVEVLLLLRGVGLALAGGPVMAAAMSAVARHQLDDASALVNVVARVGGALGSAVMVVILTSNLPGGESGAATADAFHVTFWWLTGASVAAYVGTRWLAAEQRSSIDRKETSA
jgi:EmrB/QacA subfamily drug resistance transporter